MSPTWGKTADILGIHDTCVVGVDLARGVTILVVPGTVFALVGWIEVYSSSKEVGLN